MIPPAKTRGCEGFQALSRSRNGDEFEVTRRQLIGYGMGATLAVYASRFISLSEIAEAAAARARTAPTDAVLVSVYLPGGCDLLSTVVPAHRYGRYADLRPGIRVKKPTQLGSTGLGIHPALTRGLGGGIKGLYDRRKVAFLPGIDYDHPDLSHFHSQHYWDVGVVSKRTTTGWLGRWLDIHGSSDNPLQGVSLDSSLSTSLHAERAPVAAVYQADSALWLPGAYGSDFDTAMDLWRRISSRSPTSSAADAAMRSARMSVDVNEKLKPFSTDSGNDSLNAKASYPSDSEFGQRLKNLAAMLDAPLGIRLATTYADVMFDTHDNQPTEHSNALTTVSEGLSAFQADLEARGIADRVLTLVWSEFGRRPEQNESNGTDHGAGGLAWVQGTRVRSGVLSEYPSLKKLDREQNLKVTLDFRQVYCSLIEQWLGTEADRVIPKARRFRRLKLVR